MKQLLRLLWGQHGVWREDLSFAKFQSNFFHCWIHQAVLPTINRTMGEKKSKRFDVILKETLSF
jgi:hypothetical protein